MEREGIEGTKGKFTKFFTHPAVGITGTIASIIGILLAVYFYLQTEKTRVLAYYINPVKAIVVKADETSNLSVTHNNKLVKTDITAVQIAIWNQGELAIKNENILEPIIVYTKNKTPILEATIRTSTRKVVGLKLDQSNLNEGRLGISWNIMERNDGGIIQLIYAGVPTTEIYLEGIIEGQKQTNKFEFGGEIKSAQEQIREDRKMKNWVGLISFSFGLVCLIVVVLLRKLSDKSELQKIFDDFIESHISAETAIKRREELFDNNFRSTKFGSRLLVFARVLDGTPLAMLVTVAIILTVMGIFLYFSSTTPSLPFNF